MDFACFYCGRTGHLKANCPDLHRAAPPQRAAEPRSSLPASHIDIQELRRQHAAVPPEVAAELAERYASQVRASKGWDHQTRETELRRRATEQCEESRRERMDHLFPATDSQ